MENKTGKYLKYALGEIILVVIGILIALSINNWNENRKDKIKEAGILKELNTDFTNNLLQFENVKKVHSNSLKSAEKFKMYINHSDLLSVKDSIAKYYFSAFNGVSYNPSNGVVESLISSGEYQLIKNDTLRNYLISWKDALQDFIEEEDVSRKLWGEKIEPYIIESGDFTNLASPKNFKLITTDQFKNLTERHIFYLKNIMRSIEDEPLQYHLKEIVRLSKKQTE
ncbi:hypothetical protein H8K90_06050 [Winogradskyella echinorum]|uniref:Uncharacterized protein n=1 Tax=Winogradskyella echinorum TaxID=538189 RepID=A0ABR6XZL7_9FLAO|nr:DUF6090 family protein [Winogradskyella echinorum]MBC3845932.1 hypothetical protein [Winogradskyella echinorum]MBC5750280.1 hypothetical protein [Winogradskyella echinorum]